ncbi:MAG: NAD(P)H-hydrate epimerase, partial [Synergistaceae bacterium]|nr:NAD(P)H-hydrate epimerase [Synergistaceae bacterium]
MINAYTAADFRQADEIAMTHYGIPGAVLMENAGRGACEVLLKRYPEANDFLILCGPGNNGGDGFVIARHLALNGRRVFIITSAAPETYRSDAAVNCNSAFKLGLRIRTSSDMSDDEIKQAVCDSSVVIDALLGTGTTGAPRGEVLRL